MTAEDGQMTTNMRTRADSKPARHHAHPFPSGGTALVAWLAVFAGYAHPCVAFPALLTSEVPVRWGKPV